MADAVLAINAGSSSVKFSLYEAAGGGLRHRMRGALDLGDKARLTVRADDGGVIHDRPLATGDDTARIGEALDWIEGEAGSLAAVGHRVVHGGTEFSAPVRLTRTVIEAIDRLTPLAPLHQPRSLMPIRAFAALRPGLPQVGCFDTAFHRSIEGPAGRLALPRRYEAEGVRRYGFHGLSYEYIASRLPEIAPDLPGKRTIVAHLGNGASLCAMRDGRSVDTTMGFSALDGLVMGTRCGAIDPGVLLYFLQEKGMAPDALQHLLYEESGLLGVSGQSSDMRTLLASGDPRAREAVELFVFRAVREVAALAATLGGLDCLVFTAGIGEHQPPVRAAIADRLRWLGAEIEAGANDAHAGLVSSPGSRVELRIVPTDEEIVIARHALAVLRA